MNTFIVCEGQWELLDGNISCLGTLQALTADQIAAESSLTDEQVDSLAEATIGVFALVFVLLILRKVL